MVLFICFFLFHCQVLSELPSPITGGTVLKVEDLQQEFSCNINIKHRFGVQASLCLNFFTYINRPVIALLRYYNKTDISICNVL